MESNRKWKRNSNVDGGLSVPCEKAKRKKKSRRKYERFMEHWSLKKNGKYFERGLR